MLEAFGGAGSGQKCFREVRVYGLWARGLNPKP